MGRPTKMSAIKRQREREKAEKTALKRQQRAERRANKGEGEDGEGGPEEASRSDLEAYGIIDPDAETSR